MSIFEDVNLYDPGNYSSGDTDYSDYGSKTGSGAAGTTLTTPGWTDTTDTTDTSKFDLNKLLENLFGSIKKGGAFAQDNPLQALLMTALLGKALTGGNRTTVGGYSGPGINMNLKATRKAIEQPEYKPYTGEAVMGRQYFEPVTYETKGAAEGGLMSLASGQYLRGKTDGMADEIPSSIDGEQPAKLSHGEFVIPADVVSHFGNGNSEAGADVLYDMMDKVRKARTGTTKQGREINPEKFFPGGIAKYSDGGAVAFADGGATNTETNLASWAGSYVTDYLSKAQALSKESYEAYTKPLVAGTSPIQKKAFTALENYQPSATFDAAAAKQYMNPYIEKALNPQLDELRRQSQISQQGLSSTFTKAGAFGGSRDAIARAENLRNLQTAQAGITGQAYQNAFDQARQQYNTARQQELQGINTQLTAGAQQYAQEQAGITANINEWNKQKMWPYQQLQFAQSMLAGLPISAVSTMPNRSALEAIGLTADQIAKLALLFKP